jgi:hypothetical protein
MKIGVQDASITYELAEPANKKKKFVRQKYSGQPASDDSELGRNNSAAAVKRPPKIMTNNRTENTSGTNSRPKSAVRFRHPDDGAKPVSPSSQRRPPKSPLPSMRRSSQGPESVVHSRPVTPNRQVKVYGEEPRFPVTSFRQEYQSMTPIPTITRVRKELVIEEIAIPWDRSCNPPDRRKLLVEETMAKHLREQKVLLAKNQGVRPGSAPSGRGHKKSIPESFARNRNSKTNGAILNLPYSELRPHASPVTWNIHEKLWNCQTKDKDDEERARPEKMKNATSLHAMYAKENAFYRRNRPVTGGAINKTQECSRLFR